MSDRLVTVEETAERLNLHPKTVLRYIRDGRLKAARIGKSYRITNADLDEFAGVASGETDTQARTTCIVDIPGISVQSAERLASFLHSAALAGDSATPPLHLETAFDASTGTMKVVVIGAPSDVGKLLEMLHLQLRSRS